MTLKPNTRPVIVPEDPALVKIKKTLVPQSPLISSELPVGNTPPAVSNTLSRTTSPAKGEVVPTDITTTTEFNADGTLYITSVTQNTNNQFYDIACGVGISVGTVNSSNVYTNITSATTKLGFDTDSGFEVADLGSGLAKIGMNSTFKCWEVNGSSGLIACGLDTVNFIAGSGITISSDNTAVPKTLTINSAGGGGVAGCNTQVQFNNSSALGANCNFTFCNTTCTLGVPNITNATGSELNVGFASLPYNSWFTTAYSNDYNYSDYQYHNSVIDSNNNVISIGIDTSLLNLLLVKTAENGTKLWSKKFSLTVSDNYRIIGGGVTVDSSNNIYFTFTANQYPSRTDYKSYIYKLSSDGNTVIWQTGYFLPYTTSGTLAPEVSIAKIILDSVGNVYIGLGLNGSTSLTPGYNQIGLIKFDSTGTLVWQKMLQNVLTGFFQGSFWKIGIDNADNVLIVYRASNEENIAKFNSSGTLIWQKNMNAGSAISFTASYLQIDSLNNIYLFDNDYGYILKVDPNGNKVLEKKLFRTADSYVLDYTSIKMDSSGNFYAGGFIQSFSEGYPLTVVKFDSNFNILWSRKITYSNPNDQFIIGLWTDSEGDIMTVKGDYIYFTGSQRLSGSNNLFVSTALVIKLKTDGSGIGTYEFKSSTGSVIYADDDWTVTNTTDIVFSDNARAFTNASGTIHSSPYTLIDVSINNYVTPFATIGKRLTINNNNIATQDYNLPSGFGFIGQSMISDGNGCIRWETPGYRPSGYYNDNLFIGELGSWCYGCSSLFDRAAYNTSLGLSSLVSITCGCYNVSIGYSVLPQLTNGSNNVAVGSSIMTNLTTGTDNIAVGTAAMNIVGPTASKNIAVGVASLQYVQSNDNSAFGYQALNRTTTGTYNIGIGYRVGYCNTVGSNNVFIGCCAGYLTCTGNNNTIIGSLVGTSGLECTVLIGAGTCERIKVDNTGFYVNGACWGSSSGTVTTVSVNSSNGFAGSVSNASTTPAITLSTSVSGLLKGNGTGISAAVAGTDYQSPISLTTTGSSGAATLIGNTLNIPQYSSGVSGVTSLNTLTGALTLSAGTNVTIGTSGSTLTICSTASGATLDAYCSFKVGNGLASSTGTNNVAIGLNALNSNTTGTNNLALGASALSTNQTGSSNIAIGYEALVFNTNSYNIALGYNAAKCITTGNNNIAFGDTVMGNAQTAIQNIAMGYAALRNNNGTGNIGIGCSTLCANTTGSDNIAMGRDSLKANAGGSYNVAVGFQSYYNHTASTGTNIALGYRAGCSITTGTDNTIIGSLSGTSGLVCTLLIGAGTCERIKVDNSGLCINGAILQGDGLSTTAAGYRYLPANSQSADYTTVASDSGKTIIHPASDANSRTFTIASNATVAYPIGTAIVFINDSANSISIAIASDTLTLVGAGTTGTRTLSQYGMATAIKISATTWYINGTNIT